MTTTKDGEMWTKGPWFVGTMNDCCFVIDRKPRPAPVDYINPNALPDVTVIAKIGPSRVDEANARLISAAPEMFEALKDMFALIDEGYLVRNTADDAEPGWAMKQLPFIKRLQVARAALLKAQGAAHE